MRYVARTRKLATFFLRPEQVAPAVVSLDLPEAERIEQYVLALPPEQLKTHHLAECLLIGLYADTSPGLSATFSASALDAMYRLYPKLKERSGFSPAEAPFYLQQRDRVLSRLAEVSREKWLEDIKQEHPAFRKVAWTGSFFPKEFEALFPTPLAPRERVVSSTLGSLPMYVLLAMNLKHFPAPPGQEQASDPSHEQYRLKDLNETREALELMKSRGLDFTEEELRAPGLKAFLATVRAATPPPGR